MAGKVEWYGPEHGRGSLDDTVSHLPGVRKSIEQGARKIYRHAQLLHSAHSKTGDSKIELEGSPPHLLDWYVLLTDVERGNWGEGGDDDEGAPSNPDRSAMSIEFGWTDKHGNVHEGLHILGRAMNAAVRKHL